MLNKKERRINRIKIVKDMSVTDYAVITISYIQSEYAVFSDITVTTTVNEYDAGYSDSGTVYLALSKGESKTATFTNTAIRNGTLLTSTGYMIEEILSISPSEDDTYIYTF